MGSLELREAGRYLQPEVPQSPLPWFVQPCRPYGTMTPRHTRVRASPQHLSPPVGLSTAALSAVSTLWLFSQSRPSWQPSWSVIYLREPGEVSRFLRLSMSLGISSVFGTRGPAVSVTPNFQLLISPLPSIWHKAVSRFSMARRWPVPLGALSKELRLGSRQEGPAII